MAKTLLHIGFDDTDSPGGMCTTFLAYKMAAKLAKDGAEFADFPRLVRLNPNIPWKTRGNGAVSISVRTADPGRAKGTASRMVRKYSDVQNGANPGLAFLEGNVPPGLADFARLALWRLIPRNDAKKFAKKSGIECEWLGNGQGVVGAVGAMGYAFGDHTLELLSYRKRSRFGTRRKISESSVRKIQQDPGTFGSYDLKKNRAMIAPRGPDPVFYGVRGESVAPLLRAARTIRSDERPDGHMIFRSNQGTGDHLQNELGHAMEPHSSGTVSGMVCDAPRALRGGHVTFSILSKGAKFWCSVYRPTGMAQDAAALLPGDAVRAGGGVRRAAQGFPRSVSLEFFEVVRLARDVRPANPACACGKRMKSKGKNQGYECARCGSRASSKVTESVPRRVERRLYLPDASAHRHLARPHSRMGRTNTARFEPSAAWLCVYE